MRVRSSIQDRLVLWTGATISGIFLILFFVIVTVQKEAIIGKHRIIGTTMIQTAIIPINDALYLADSTNEDFLQAFINNFTREYRDQIKFAMILDVGGRVIAHSDIRQDNTVLDDIYSRAALETIDPAYHIYDDPKYGWVLEIAAPLGLVSQSHGAIRLGLDAQALRREISRKTLLIMGLFTVALLLVIVIVQKIGRSATRKLRYTVEAMDNFNIQAHEPLELSRSNDEIGLLNDRFTKLQQRLIDARHSMEATNRNLIQTEKLAAMGRMAAGVAHEINNPLMGLKNCLHLLKIDPEHRDDHLRLLQEGLERIEVTVSRLLESARKKMGRVKSFDVNLSVRDVLNLLGHRLSKGKIITQMQLAENIPILKNNKSGFEEALLNLCMNALDAIGEIGTLLLRTELQEDHVVITVGDSGPGIPEEVEATMYEPFVTTKEVGKGTGLGLYVTRELIHSMGGSIRYGRSTLGGAEFRIELPLEPGTAKE